MHLDKYSEPGDMFAKLVIPVEYPKLPMALAVSGEPLSGPISCQTDKAYEACMTSVGSECVLVHTQRETPPFIFISIFVTL